MVFQICLPYYHRALVFLKSFDSLFMSLIILDSLFRMVIPLNGVLRTVNLPCVVSVDTHCVLIYADIFNNELISVRAWFSVRRVCGVGWGDIILSSVTFAPANGSTFFSPDVAFPSLSNVLAIAISHHKFR